MKELSKCTAAGMCSRGRLRKRGFAAGGVEGRWRWESKSEKREAGLSLRLVERGARISAVLSTER